MNLTNEQLNTIIEQNQTIIKALAIIIQQKEQWNTRNQRKKTKEEETAEKNKEAIVNIARKRADVSQR